MACNSTGLCRVGPCLWVHSPWIRHFLSSVAFHPFFTSCFLGELQGNVKRIFEVQGQGTDTWGLSVIAASAALMNRWWGWTGFQVAVLEGEVYHV